MSKFKVKFWGVRGSYPTPGESSIKYGGNTTCIEIQTDNEILIIDAGTGIVNLGKELLNEKKFKNINIIFTHTHKDHTEGFSSFLPAFNGQYRINMFGPKFLGVNIEEAISNSMAYSYFPVIYDEMGALRVTLNVKDTDIIIFKPEKSSPIIYNKYHENYEIKDENLTVKIMKGYNHPKSGVYIYRIEYKGKSFVFATDVESYIDGDHKLINFAKNADVLVHDAAYDRKTYLKKQGWGHSTPEMAAFNAKMANVKRLYLTHHDPEDTEKAIEEKVKAAKPIFEESYLAYENLEIDLFKM